ncbi:exodeoxyribonuclease VII large subunit, partial [Parabacteroides distasonis]
AAALLISRLKEVSDHIDSCRDAIASIVWGIINTEQQRIQTLAARVPMIFSVVKTKHTATIDMYMQRLLSAMQQRFVRERHRVEMLAQRAGAMNPEKILRQGYSITTLNGKAVRNIS